MLLKRSASTQSKTSKAKTKIKKSSKQIITTDDTRKICLFVLIGKAIVTIIYIMYKQIVSMLKVLT